MPNHSVRPFLKMITGDFVGEVPASDLVSGDVLATGVVFNLDRDPETGEVLFDTMHALESYEPDDLIFRIGRLTKTAYETVSAYREAERTR